MLKKIKKLCHIIKYFFEDEDNLLLHLMEIKAYETLEDCLELEVGLTEEVEDFIFHVRTYYDIPKALAATKYPDLKEKDVEKMMVKYRKGNMDMRDVMLLADFLEDVETQRAVERDLIFEHAKILPFGFKL
jgi:hypothetical protein